MHYAMWCQSVSHSIPVSEGVSEDLARSSPAEALGSHAHHQESHGRRIAEGRLAHAVGSHGLLLLAGSVEDDATAVAERHGR